MKMERKSGKRLLVAIGILVFISLTACDTNQDRNFTSIEGFYTCEEGSAYSGIRKYILEIDKVSSQDNTYIIANFHNQGDNEFVYAQYQNDTLYIQNQVISSLFVNGKGKVFDDFKRIELIYITDDGVLELKYSALLER